MTDRDDRAAREQAAMDEIAELLAKLPTSTTATFDSRERDGLTQISSVVAEFHESHRREIDRLLEMTPLGRLTLADRAERERRATFSGRGADSGNRKTVIGFSSGTKDVTVARALESTHGGCASYAYNVLHGRVYSVPEDMHRRILGQSAEGRKILLGTSA